MALDPNFFKFRVWVLAGLSLIFLSATFYFIYLKAPARFPVKTVITIDERAGLNAVAQTLYRDKIIRSPFWFRVAVILTAGERGVKAGDYFFEKPANVFSVGWRLSRGAFGLTPVKITFPEGITTAQMSSVLSDDLVDFDAKEFLKEALPEEGYLFPDTYLFPPNAKPKQVMTVFQDNFKSKIQGLSDQLSAFGKPLKDVVIMASILEAEARTTETRKIIAGILWKRLSLGMPLQVDAPFQYIIGKNTFQLTDQDLKINSPYNTYIHTGLPPTAIDNPGLDALTSEVNPTKSPYFYYLSDVRGNMHYAKTYEEHLANKEKYLR